MEEKYDIIVLGTGLKECCLSGLLSVKGKKVLHMDRNNYYGGESASLNLEQLYQKFKSPETKIPEEFGRARDFNVDLCPKFLMACGNLVKMLLHTKVTRYLDFRVVAGSYVMKDGRIHKVPASSSEALGTRLMGMFQKRRFKNYLEYVQAYDKADPATHKGLDLESKTTNADLFKHFSCDDNTQAFTGHGMALYLDDSYLQQPAIECVERVKLYAYSVSRYGSSPYIYPMWGLGGLPEGFSRLSAIHGGVYMLNKPIEEIIYGPDGRVTGVRSEGEVAYCDQLIADPTYFVDTDKVRKTGQVARCISILNHPIENTNDADSCQIIIPARQVPGRTSDIYLSCVSSVHKAASDGFWVTCISLTVETDNPKTEMAPALRLLGKREQDFFWVSDLYEPTGDGSADGVYISNSFDATSHFESATREVMQMFERVTGSPVDMAASAEPDDLQEM